MRPQRFSIHIPDAQISDLRGRVAATRWPGDIVEYAWKGGVPEAYLRDVLEYWGTRFEWRRQETRLNRLPQFLARVEGLDIHYVHVTGSGRAPLPLIMTHGWPGSFLEMEAVIPLLTDPGRHGGDPDDAFHLVVPSLPGFGFSQRPKQQGVDACAIARLWSKLMTGLGYTRFAAQGGDWGASVSTWLARNCPQAVCAFHLNFIPGSYRPFQGAGSAPLSPAEEAYLRQLAQWQEAEGGYGHIQRTKPQTLAYALNDSPAGLAAWIVEKYRGWSDCDGRIGRRFTHDQLLTNISLYWFTQTIGSSMRLYQQSAAQPLAFAEGERIAPPVGVAVFPNEVAMPPRSWVERVCDVRRWSQMPRGGHFAAMEEPLLLVEEIRAFFRPFR